MGEVGVEPTTHFNSSSTALKAEHTTECRALLLKWYQKNVDRAPIAKLSIQIRLRYSMPRLKSPKVPKPLLSFVSYEGYEDRFQIR